MQFDWTISVGNVITAIVFFLTVVAAAWKMYNALVRRVALFEELLKEHTSTLMRHASRMEKQDDLLREIIGDVQRLIGRMETSHTEELSQAAATAVKVIETAAQAAAQKLLDMAAGKKKEHCV